MDDLSLMAADMMAGGLMLLVHKLPLGNRLSWALLAAIAAGWFALRFRPFAVPLDEATAERLVEIGQHASILAGFVGLSIMSSHMWQTDPPEPASERPDRTAGLSPRKEGWRPPWADWKMALIRYMPAEVMILYGSFTALLAMLEPEGDLSMGLTGLAVAGIGTVFTYIRLQHV